MVLVKFKFLPFFVYSRLLFSILSNFLSSINLTKSVSKSSSILLTNSDNLLEILLILKYHTNFRLQTLLDISVVDYPHKANGRFEVYYNLLSFDSLVFRLFLKLYISYDKVLPSSSKLFSSSNWLEREVYDMFGIYFNDHPDLRRILTDYGFEGFPLRKDFPLIGYNEVRYDEEQKRLLLEPVSSVQVYRNFEFISPWSIDFN